MERAFLVNVQFTDRAYRDSWAVEESAEELKALVQSGGLEVLDQVVVKKDRPTPNFFIGKGKVEELAERSLALKADAVVFGEDLTFPQQRNLEDLLQRKVVDRTQLILDIFAQRAHSQEGKVQVELAQLQYLLPRLAGKGILLSRLGGGIGTRGPGEQKLEMDRRRIRLRIGRLKEELNEIHRRRGIARQKREEELPTVALVGYTNVGKTTLLNRLTLAEAPAENRLFTTLDPLVRRLTLPNRQPILLSDTVGFLHKLPHHLIEAFRATLEEVTESHLLLHVMDAASPRLEEENAAVREVLEQLGVEKKPMVGVLNKVDQLDSASQEGLKRRYLEAIQISALSGQGVEELLDRLMNALASLSQEATIWISGKDQHWLDQIYRQGQVLTRRDENGGISLTARVPHRLYGRLAKAGLIRTGRLY